MGARGNSGVILSQIVRGICEVWGQANSLDTAVFKRAVVEGQHAAYRAVKTPVEGTMLTVIREMATAAQAVPDSLGLEHLLAAVEEAGRIAVENTTAQLPALQKAGVVDAGGYGLLVLFRGLAAGIEDLMRGGKVVAGARSRSAPSARRCVHRRRPPRAAAWYRRGAQRALRVPLLHELPRHRAGDRPRGVRGVPPAARRQRPRGGRRAHRQGARPRQRPRRRAQRSAQARRHRRRRDQRHARADARARRAAGHPGAGGRRGRRRGRRRRGRRRQPAALPRARLPRDRRRGPVHEPERRPAARGGRGARRPGGRRSCRTTAT